MRSTRRKRRRNNFRQKTSVNFTAIVVIMSIAILFGYGTAKFIIYPLFNSDTTKETTDSGFKIEKFLSFFFQDDSVNAEKPPVEDSQGDKNTDTKIVEDMEKNTDTKIVEDKLTVKEDTPALTTAQNGYCIQFGSFSTMLSAESLASQLKTSGIDTEIVEKDGAFKVISQLFEQKEQAVATMNSLVGSQFADAFITQR